MADKKRYGRILQRLRERRGLTYKEIGDACGLGSRRYAALEKGDGVLQASEVQALLNICHLTWEEFQRLADIQQATDEVLDEALDRGENRAQELYGRRHDAPARLSPTVELRDAPPQTSRRTGPGARLFVDLDALWNQAQGFGRLSVGELLEVRIGGRIYLFRLETYIP